MLFPYITEYVPIPCTFSCSLFFLFYRSENTAMQAKSYVKIRDVDAFQAAVAALSYAEPVVRTTRSSF